jgi:hypothetical protein
MKLGKQFLIVSVGSNTKSEHPTSSPLCLLIAVAKSYPFLSLYVLEDFLDNLSWW